MGDGMPFVMEKGPVWEFFDREYSPGGRLGDVDSRLLLLNGLRRPSALPVGQADTPDNYWSNLFIGAYLNEPSLASVMGPVLKQHIEQDWFTGLAVGDEHGWLNWASNPAEVVARGLARAVEISLGVRYHVELPEHGATEEVPLADASHVTRCWPIEFYWACPFPVFQCWIAWRPVPPGHGFGREGLVTFTYTTPAPAWSYLAKCPAEDGVVVDENGMEHVAPLGRVDDAPPGVRHELVDRNILPKGLVMIGESCTEVLCSPVVQESEGDGLRVDPGRFRESADDGAGADELAEQGLRLVTEGVDRGRNQFVLDLPILEGVGPVATVSPFNDVGGYAEYR